MLPLSIIGSGGIDSSVPGGDMLCTGVGRVGISYMNRSDTGCVPALSGGLSGPGVNESAS